jgi:polyhydroxybutyrate depolymerase
MMYDLSIVTVFEALVARAVRHLLLACVLIVVSGLQTSAVLAKIRQPVPTSAELEALGFSERSVTVKGHQRWYLVLPPRDASRPAPVLVVLHGGSQSMRHLFSKTAGATRGWPALALRENALLLVPNGTNADTGDAAGDNQNWTDLRADVARETVADDVGFIRALLDAEEANYNVDRRRLYVTGASNGGIMTFRLLMEMPERFAAAATFVAALPVDEGRFNMPSRPTPLLLANGTKDPLMRWDGGRIAGNRGETRSVADTIAWWLKANGANSKPATVTQVPDRDPADDCIITRADFAAKAGGAPVVTYTMQGGGHSLPSIKYKLPDNWGVRRFIGPVCRDAEGVDLVWNFVSQFRRR